MNEMQWSEGQFKELTKFDEYRNGRDQVVPYVPPAQDIQPVKNQPVVTLEMKRYFAAGGFTTFCMVLISVAEQGAFAAAAATGGSIIAVGGGIGIVWIILKSCFTWTPSEKKQTGGGGGEWEEFYQKQEQGYRRKV